MSAPYRRFTDPAQTIPLIRDLSVRTVVFDVEPLIAFWDTDQHILTAGTAAILDRLAANPARLGHVVFATNSPRRPPTIPIRDGLHIGYLALARKPLRTAPYRRLPTPGVVVGDQIATDGVLAWRLGYAFLHYTPATHDTPIGPRVMGGLGRPLHGLLFPNVRGG
jgi:predicted HAD superfamily phosphohydrolase YqeG